MKLITNIVRVVGSATEQPNRIIDDVIFARTTDNSDFEKSSEHWSYDKVIYNYEARII